MDRFDMLIGGAWVQAYDGTVFRSANPATGEIWRDIPQAMVADVDQAARGEADAALRGPWEAMTAAERDQSLRQLVDLMTDAFETLGRVETSDTGNMYSETAWQARDTCELYQFFAGVADKLADEILPIDKPDMFGITKRDPLGVVAAVINWNSQHYLSTTKLVQALVDGIFTKDSARSLCMSKVIRTGLIRINTNPTNSSIAAFGGVKGEGYGRKAGFQAMYDDKHPKSVWMNRSDYPNCQSGSI